MLVEGINSDYGAKMIIKNIKQQQRIHKAWADKLNEAAKLEFDEMRKQFPKVHATFEPPKDAVAIEAGNFEICKHFCVDDETKDAFDFSNPRTKTVSETVAANVVAYEGIVSALAEEDDEEFKKIYKNLKGEYEKYFKLAADLILSDYYADYAAFVEENR